MWGSGPVISCWLVIVFILIPMGNLSQASTSHGGILHSRWYASTATNMSQPGLNMFENSVYFESCQVSRQSRIHYSSVYLAMVLGMLANVGFSTRACVAKRATRRGFFANRWINWWRIISDQLMEQKQGLGLRKQRSLGGRDWVLSIQKSLLFWLSFESIVTHQIDGWRHCHLQAYGKLTVAATQSGLAPWCWEEYDRTCFFLAGWNILYKLLNVTVWWYYMMWYTDILHNSHYYVIAIESKTIYYSVCTTWQCYSHDIKQYNAMPHEITQDMMTQ